MATFFSLNDGSLSASSTYGYSISSYEKFDGITQLVLPLSSNAVTILESSNGTSISAIAVNIHSRSASPTNYLKIDISKQLDFNKLVDNSTNSYSVSNIGGVYNTVLTPYSTGGWSGKFNGSTSYMVATDNSNIFQLGTGDFTVECWYYATASKLYPAILEIGSHQTTTGVGFMAQNGGALRPVLWSGFSTSGQFQPVNTPTYTLNSWNHIVWQRTSSQLKIYVNGVGSNNLACTRNFSITTNVSIGYAKGANLGANYYANGYISNLKVTKGRAIYSIDFTSSLLYPLSSSSDTSLLLFQNPYLRDKSNNTVSLSASPSFEISNVSYPNSPTTGIKYYPRTYGGSAYFNGSSYGEVTMQSISSSDDFTHECWFYPKSLPASNSYSVISDTNSSIFSNKITYALSANSTSESVIAVWFAGYNKTLGTTILNTWNHIAITRQGSNLRIFFNGKLKDGPINNTSSITEQVLSIGARIIGSDLYPFTGYIANVRFVKGSALYTTDFTPTTASLQNVAGTQLLVNFDNIGEIPVMTTSYPISSFTVYTDTNNLFSNYSQNWQILKLPTPLSSYSGDGLLFDISTTDSNKLSLMGDDTSYYDATKLNTLQIAGGTATYDNVTFNDITSPEMRFDGTSTVLSANSANFQLGTGDFTVECWYYASGSNAYPTVLEIGNGGTITGAAFFMQDNGALTPLMWSGPNTSYKLLPINTPTYTLNSWNHIVWQRTSGQLKIYVNGVGSNNLACTRDISNNPNVSIGYQLGYNGGISRYVNGYISNLRVIKKAIYAQNFIPPTQYDITKTPETVFLMKTGKRFNKSLLSNNIYVPSSNDTIHIGGALKGSTTEARIVTVDTLTADSVFVHNAGTLAFPLTSSKTLTVAGSGGLHVTSGGTLNIGTSSGYIPLSTTHSLVLSTTNDIDIHNGGSLNIYGSPKLSNVYLISNVLPGQRTFTVNTPISSDWSVGDTLVFTPNTSQRTSFDVLTLSSFLSDTTFTTTTSSVYNHHALSALSFFPTSVVNLTNKNVKIKGTNSSLRISDNNIPINIINVGLEIKDILNQYSNNHTISSSILNGTTYKLTNTSKTLSSLSLNDNIFYKPLSTINFNLANINGLNFSNNLILSSVDNGMEIVGASISAMNINDNTIIAPSNIGATFSNINANGSFGCKVYNANGNGVYLYGTNTGIDTFNLYAYNCNSNGIYVDGSLWAVKTLNFSNIIASNNATIGFKFHNNAIVTTLNINGLTACSNSNGAGFEGYNVCGNFTNITTSNNSTVGFKIYGNSTNPLSAISLNVNGLTASNNLNDTGFEVYNIFGNLSSIVLNNNAAYGMKTSIGNGATTIDGLTSILSASTGSVNPLSIFTSTNYYKTLIKNSVLSANPNNTSSVGLVLDSCIFKQFEFNDSTISTTTPIRLNTTYSICEGSYLFNNSYLGDAPLGTGISGKYQSDVGKTAGFVFNNLNKVPNYNKSYVAAGSRTLDYTTQSIIDADKPSERLTPNSTTTKLRSGSKYIAADKNDVMGILVYIRKSILSDGVAYNGNYPRLILKRNAAIGVNSDIVLAQLDETNDISGSYIPLSGSTSSAIDNGVFEFYVDCDGNNGGYINIDNWNAI